MAFIKVEENPYSAELIELSKLTEKTFNPRDYIDLSTAIKVNCELLGSLADVGGESIDGKSVNRVMSDDVDRATGEVLAPSGKTEDITCLNFQKGDILLHKYAVRIGRAGIADFDGYADNHFIVVKPLKIDGHYLLLALRSHPVLIQLPYRETARPGVWNDDIKRLHIPRLGDVEEEIGSFIREIFTLRKRARIVLNGLLDNFDKAISSKMPADYSFLMGVQTLSDATLDPGYYFIKAIEIMFPEHIILGKTVDIIYPSSLNAGENYTAVTLNDYRFEGIVPQTLKSVERLWEKNFAKPGDLILNRLHSSGDKIAKATVILPELNYLKSVSLTLDVSKVVKVPIYDQLFILRLKKDAKISPYYLSMILNSNLFQYMFQFLMGGSTGRQRLRKSKLSLVRLPILSEHLMRAFSEATRICMEVFSETLRMLIRLTHIYEEVVYGKATCKELTLLINEEKEKMKALKGNSIENAVREMSKTELLQYSIELPSLK